MDEKLTKKEKRALAKEEKREKREREEKMGSVKKWLTWVIVLGLLVFGGVRFADWLRTPVPGTEVGTTEISEDEWVKGDASASATLVEYSDFQCPACGSYYPVVRQLSEDFGENLRVVYRHFPLISIHPNAVPAARAAEAAGIQEMFWEMHDILFENQSEWSVEKDPEDFFVTYAEELGLDVEKFEEDMNSQEVQDKINQDIVSGNQLGVNATPTFFLNGERIANPAGLESFTQLIQGELE